MSLSTNKISLRLELVVCSRMKYPCLYGYMCFDYHHDCFKIYTLYFSRIPVIPTKLSILHLYVYMYIVFKSKSYNHET